MVLLCGRIIHQLLLVFAEKLQAYRFKILVGDCFCPSQNIIIHLVRVFRSRLHIVLHINLVILVCRPDSHNTHLELPRPFGYECLHLDDVLLFDCQNRLDFFVGDIPFFCGYFAVFIAKRKIPILFSVGTCLDGSSFHHEEVNDFAVFP